MDNNIFIQNGYCKKNEVVKFKIKYDNVIGIMPNHDMLSTTGFIANADGYWVVAGNI